MEHEPRILRIDPSDQAQVMNFIKNDLGICIDILTSGGILVFPTETLYGLGVDIQQETAIETLMHLKGRPENMPIAVAVANLSQARQVAKISDKAERFINECLPKPVTLLLPVLDNTSRRLTGGSELIGLRFPDEPITKILLEHFGPITATSANIHGTDDPQTIAQIIDQLGNEVDIYIDTGPSRLGVPSTVVDISRNTIKIIRYGACSGVELEKYIRRS